MSASYATVYYLLTIVGVMFAYTFLWDLWLGFWNMALVFGANSPVFMLFYTIQVYIPIFFFISATFGYIASIRRPY